MIEWVLAIGLVLAALNLLVLYGITHQHRDRLASLEMKRAFTGDVGPCGQRAPLVDGHPAGPVHCELNAGHAGGHKAATPGFPGTTAQWWEEPPPAGDPLDGLTEGELRALGASALDRADELELARRSGRA